MTKENKLLLGTTLLAVVLFSFCLWAAVDTRDGTSINSETNIDGFSSNLDDADGQEITAAAGSCGNFEDCDTFNDNSYTGVWTSRNGTWVEQNQEMDLTVSNTEESITKDQALSETAHIYSKIQLGANHYTDNAYIGVYMRIDGNGDGYFCGCSERSGGAIRCYIFDIDNYTWQNSIAYQEIASTSLDDGDWLAFYGHGSGTAFECEVEHSDTDPGDPGTWSNEANPACGGDTDCAHDSGTGHGLYGDSTDAAFDNYYVKSSSSAL